MTNKNSSGKIPKKNHDNSLKVIYGVLGTILLVLLIMIARSLLSGGSTTKTGLNQLDQGIAIANKASSLFQQDNENACEALKMLEEGIGKMEAELNKYRDKEDNLPAKYARYDTKLAEWLSLRKGFREQCFIVKERKERKNNSK